MTHLDDTALSLVALGETPDPADAAHLDACATCRAELARLQRTVTTARSLDPTDLDPPAPPAHVWDAIAAEVGADVTADDGIRVEESEDTGTAAHPGGVVDLASRRRPPFQPPRWLSVAAAVVVLVVAIGAVIAVVRSSDSSSGQEIALAAIGGSNASGRAAVVTHDGAKALKVDTSGLAPLDGSDYELWLMNPATKSFVPLGSVEPGVRSVHPIPSGVTVKTDPYVDISVEPRDGNPAHSTVSVLRGHF